MPKCYAKNQHVLTPFSTNFNLLGHMPSMDGVPPRASPMAALKSLV
jgi:hypothetical protein